MGVFAGPDVSESGLVLALDAASPKNYNLTEVEYLIVAGGGSGGIAEANPAGDGAGGGGGGGVLTNIGSPLSISPSQSYAIVVGDGGANASGGNSSAFGLTAFGGGRGGNVRNASVTSGGSGGGAGGNCNQTNRTGGAGTAGQGNRGGNDLAINTDCSLRGGRGGGGAGFAAADAASSQGTSGGDGVISYISGTGIYYGGGGGGGRGASNGVGGAGGLGGGGSGSNGTVVATAGSANTGGGGGGGASSGTGTPQLTGGNGGSGIVIVRYPGPQKAIGGTVTSVGGYTIHTFTTVGSTTFTPLVATNNSAISGLSDLSNRGNFGTSVNGPTYSSANGGSIVFDGTDDYISGTINGSVFTGNFTQSAWIYKLNNTQIWQGVFTNSSPLTNYTYLMTFGNGSVQAPFNSVGVNQVGVLNDGVFLDIGTHTNRWLYITITKTGSTLNIYCYKDGSLLQTSGTINWNGGNFATTNNYQIGRHWAGGGIVPLQGNVAQVQVYNRALTATEIQQNYNATRGRFGV